MPYLTGEAGEPALLLSVKCELTVGSEGLSSAVCVAETGLLPKREMPGPSTPCNRKREPLILEWGSLLY